MPFFQEPHFFFIWAFFSSFLAFILASSAAGTPISNHFLKTCLRSIFLYFLQMLLAFLFMKAPISRGVTFMSPFLSAEEKGLKSMAIFMTPKIPNMLPLPFFFIIFFIHLPFLFLGLAASLTAAPASVATSVGSSFWGTPQKVLMPESIFFMKFFLFS